MILRGFGAMMFAAALGGCTTQMRPVPTGGNQSDGTVDLSYSYLDSQRAVVDWNLATADAAKRCGDWGYSAATPVGEPRKYCEIEGWPTGCVKTVISRTYQCLGDSKGKTAEK